MSERASLYCRARRITSGISIATAYDLAAWGGSGYPRDACGGSRCLLIYGQFFRVGNDRGRNCCQRDDDCSENISEQDRKGSRGGSPLVGCWNGREDGRGL